jgi:histidinol-phosphate phosphatase family protein
MKGEKPIKLYVFDADGTLRGCTVPGQPCPNRAGEWELLPGVRERLAQVAWDERAGPHFAVATNQGGVGLGYFTAAEARALVVALVEAAFGRAAPPGSIEICTHAPYARCACRKPKGEMIRRLMRRFRALPEETLYVGDMDTDREAARDAGCRFLWAHEFFGWDVPEEIAEATGAGVEDCATDEALATGETRAAEETPVESDRGSR